MNEFDLIEKITHGVPISSNSLIRGVGDDCAIFVGANGKDVLVTMDALFENIHFKSEWTTPRTLGRKALSVNLSDIAAMGGKPLYYLVSVGIPKGTCGKSIEEISEGMAQVAATYRMILIGGDTCTSDHGILLSVTAIGEIDHNKAVLRSGAKPGDCVYVTGALGGSALGLSCLELGIRGMETREFLKRHNDPIPRLSVGQWLSASSCVSSMIDISDGLAIDLGHIAEINKVGVKIFREKIPTLKEFDQICGLCHKDPSVLSVTGGEDYELAFTVFKEKNHLFEKMLKVVQPTFNHSITKIGEVFEGSSVHAIDIHGKDIPLPKAGFEHKF